jgi:hypothetical protein
LPILADALEDAGCDAPEFVIHCRNPGPHVLGCWAVDQVLGKEQNAGRTSAAAHRPCQDGPS